MYLCLVKAGDFKAHRIGIEISQKIKEVSVHEKILSFSFVDVPGHVHFIYNQSHLW